MNLYELVLVKAYYDRKREKGEGLFSHARDPEWEELHEKHNQMEQQFKAEAGRIFNLEEYTLKIEAVRQITKQEETMEKNYEFKIGDKVRIRKDSEYYVGSENNPKYKTGTVVGFNEGWVHPIQVSWGGGWENCYRARDLEPAYGCEGSQKESSQDRPIKDSIRSIRDRIYQIREDILSLEAEQKNLIEILDKEGFILKDFAAEPLIPEGVDVDDWRTWRVGDEVEMLRTWFDLEEGGIYPILEIAPGGHDDPLPVLVGTSDDWPELECLRWHSRPGK